MRVTIGALTPTGLEGWYGEQWPAWSDGGERWELRYFGQWYAEDRWVQVEGRWYAIGSFGAIVHAPSGTVRQFRGEWPMPSACRAYYRVQFPLALDRLWGSYAPRHSSGSAAGSADDPAAGAEGRIQAGQVRLTA